jgi:hypothetical protein
MPILNVSLTYLDLSLLVPSKSNISAANTLIYRACNLVVIVSLLKTHPGHWARGTGQLTRWLCVSSGFATPGTELSARGTLHNGCGLDPLVTGESKIPENLGVNGEMDHVAEIMANYLSLPENAFPMSEEVRGLPNQGI